MSQPQTRGQRRMEAWEAQERHTSPEAHQIKSQSPSSAEGVVKRVRGTAKSQSPVEDGPIEEQVGRYRFLLLHKTSCLQANVSACLGFNTVHLRGNEYHKPREPKYHHP